MARQTNDHLMELSPDQLPDGSHYVVIDDGWNQKSGKVDPDILSDYEKHQMDDGTYNVGACDLLDHVNAVDREPSEITTYILGTGHDN